MPLYTKCYKCNTVHAVGAPCGKDPIQSVAVNERKRKLLALRGGKTRNIARTPVSHKNREYIKTSSGKMCNHCGNYAPKGQVDHITPIGLGGSNFIENLQWLCVPCHKIKTISDVRKIRQKQRTEEVMATL